jgi:hypothetical protein
MRRILDHHGVSKHATIYSAIVRMCAIFALTSWLVQGMSGAQVRAAIVRTPSRMTLSLELNIKPTVRSAYSPDGNRYATTVTAIPL